jgi:hypothetical protein
MALLEIPAARESPLRAPRPHAMVRSGALNHAKRFYWISARERRAASDRTCKTTMNQTARF